MQLLDEVRSNCRAIAESARFVSIDLEAWREPPRADASDPPPGSPDQVLQLDSINFGSGWFPTLRKRPGMSGYRTVAAAFAERGPWSNRQLRTLDAAGVAAALGQEPGHPLMRLYAQALRDLGALIDAGELLPQGRAEREIRACAVHACEQLGDAAAVPPRELDRRLWHRGQAPEYKRFPRHRTRTVYY